MLDRYGRVQVVALNNENATKARIIEALTNLAARVQPEDALVVYYAGHGTFGYNVSRSQIDLAGLQSILVHSLSDRDLERAFEGIDGGLFLLIIDACNSGGARGGGKTAWANEQQGTGLR